MAPGITIQLITKQEQINFVISDNGSGIDTANFEKIFVPFLTTKKMDPALGWRLLVKLYYYKEVKFLFNRKHS